MAGGCSCCCYCDMLITMLTSSLILRLELNKKIRFICGYHHHLSCVCPKLLSGCPNVPSSGVLVSQCLGVQVSWCLSVLLYQCPGVLVLRCPCVWVSLCPKVLVCQCPDDPVPWCFTLGISPLQPNLS